MNAYGDLVIIFHFSYLTKDNFFLKDEFLIGMINKVSLKISTL